MIEERLVAIKDRVRLLNSPCDSGKSIGLIGTVENIFPTARSDGTVWFNYSIQIRPGYGVSCRIEDIALVDIYGDIY